MFKCVVFIGYGRYGPYIDMKQVIPWPDITNEAMQATMDLSGKRYDDILEEMGYPGAAQLCKDMVGMRLRKRYAMLDEFIFNLDFEPTDEELLALAAQPRRNKHLLDDRFLVERTDKENEDDDPMYR